MFALAKSALFVFVMAIAILLVSGCDLSLPNGAGSSGDTVAPSVDGFPVSGSEGIYQNSNLNELCLQDDCDPDYASYPDSERVFEHLFDNSICALDYDPNQSSQMLINDSFNQSLVRVHYSKEDLFFIAWVAMRLQINPHFLLGLVRQESLGNCAAVSFAGGEGCFQITNGFGRLQLQQSYETRVIGWHWNVGNTSSYNGSLFINPTTWFGTRPLTDQYRVTVDPQSESVLGQKVSSVVNFPFGAIASALYVHWQTLFLYHNYDDTAPLVASLIDGDPEERAALMGSGLQRRNHGIGESFA